MAEGEGDLYMMVKEEEQYVHLHSRPKGTAPQGQLQ